MSTIECISVNLVIWFDEKVRYVKKVKNHCDNRKEFENPILVYSSLNFSRKIFTDFECIPRAFCTTREKD